MALNLADLRTYLVDVLTRRHDPLMVSITGRMYEPDLAAILATIDTLPKALTARPLVGDLSAMDGEHDGFAVGTILYLDALGSVPGVPEDLLAAAARVREALVPTRSVVSEKYSRESDRARTNRAKLPGLKADLDRFPVATGGTLYTWAEAFVSRGEKLGELLSARVDASAAGTPEQRQQARTILHTTIGLLGRFRSTLDDEVRRNPDLPRDLDHQLFGMLDQLQEAAKSRRKAATEPVPPTPAPQ